jgi:LmbE family N-acetylglucosaminyl deacetylase
MTSYSLLAVFAHPDDETFSAGGALAAYAAAGVRVTLVCATRGEVGRIRRPELATPATLGQVRERELRCAAWQLGVADLRFLGYRDSGMAGTPENADPRALINAPPAAVVARLVGVLRAVRPQVVITFDPQGGYGHPDHIAVHRCTVAAFYAAGDPSAFPAQGYAWRPVRLFYCVPPRPHDRTQVVLDVREAAPAKWAALTCHQTQLGPNHALRSLPEAAFQEALGWEGFALAAPPPRPGLRLFDLFAFL